ncbi:ASPARTIC PROTEASE IN GUARD CELL 1 protein [Nymphaea thermarum]|nr:ASPARTIC PROTEASE IN GUARD CELL 1 protein [Nymphaea thermarum]
MERASFLVLFPFFLLLSSASADLVSHQTLVVRPLSSPPILDSSIPWSDTLFEAESFSDLDSLSASASLFLRLEHRDSLAYNSTPAELFSLRLNRDAARVDFIVRQTCLYQVSYGDGSFTVGDFSTETLAFRSATIGRVALGCGHDNEGLFAGAAGLLGLGRGDLSFPSQAGRIFGQRFSYCLADRQAGSTQGSSLVFGDAASPPTGTGAAGGTVIYTPMVTNPRLGTFYYVELAGISVGGTPIPVPTSEFQISSDGSGGVIVDSGTSVTRLVQPAYEAMRDAFRSGTTHLRRTTGGFSLFDTCYDLSGQTVVKVPTVVFHFSRGADLSLPATNYLIPVNSSGLFCFAFAGTTGGLSIIGNIQQQGIRVVLDSAGSRVGFIPHAC